eukprot:GHVP01005177.1.p1 GENE.GHVP01005177.1~~GHVP01005177.1.p1  ORF type:complete len:1056 (+),score=189.34 GHVP01005177.1:278-3169(+)
MSKLFTLKGHTDYVRSVNFAKNENPWIVSTSDDMTAKIWNFQSRECIATLAGHTNYVMSASFHPIKDQVLTGSLDGSFRLWDLSGLKKVSTKSTEKVEFFSSNEPDVLHILDANNMGIDYIEFHENKDMILTCGEDRTVMLWKYNKDSIWLQETFHGHTDNVMCGKFHLEDDSILSCGEDGTIRINTYRKKEGVKTGIICERKERFWCISKNNTEDIYAAGHDSGFIVFRLQGDKLLYKQSKKNVFFVGKESVKKQEIDKRCVGTLFLVGGHECVRIDVGPNGKDVIVSEKQTSLLYSGVKSPRRLSISSSIFISDDTIAGIGKKGVEVYRSGGMDKKNIPNTSQYVKIFHGKRSSFIGQSIEGLFLVDMDDGTITGNIKILEVSDIKWNPKGNKCCISHGKNISVTDENLKLLYSLKEEAFIESVVWDGDLLYYSVESSLKALLSNSKIVMIASLESPYLVSITGTLLTYFTNDKKLKQKQLELSFLYLQKALLDKDRKRVEALIEEGQGLIGQSVISEICDSDFPSLSLSFISNKKEKFEVAVKCGDLKTAVEVAEKIKDRVTWETLSYKSEYLGDYNTALYASRKAKDKERAGLLAWIMGMEPNNTDNMKSSIAPKNNSSLFAAVLNEDYEAQREAYGELSYLLSDVSEDIPDRVFVPRNEYALNINREDIGTLPVQTDIPEEDMPELSSSTSECNIFEGYGVQMIDLLKEDKIDEAHELMASKYGIRDPSKLSTYFKQSTEYNNGGDGFFEEEEGDDYFTTTGAEDLMKEGVGLTSKGGFPDALKIFKELFKYMSLVRKEADDNTSELLMKTREYGRGLMMEIEKKKETKNKNTERVVELACYFTLCDLYKEHKELTLRSAMSVSFKNGYRKISRQLAQKFIDDFGAHNTQTRKIMRDNSEINEELNIEFDDDTIVCNGSFKAILNESNYFRCSYCKAIYGEEYEGSECRICELGIVID